MTDSSVVVVGGGHNGLTCAAYLARAGLDVLVLEARDTVGGCAATVDAVGARVNVCNCDHAMIRASGVVEELDLASHGLRYLDVDPWQLSMNWDGTPPWFLFHDPHRTLDGLRLTYPSEVDGYRRYLRAALPVADLVIEMTRDPPRTAALLRGLAARRARGPATLLRWNRMSIGQVMSSFFATDALRTPVVTTGPAVWGLSPDARGSGVGAVGYALRHRVQVGRPAGGSGALPAALLAACKAAGGKIRCGIRVEGVMSEGGRVRGVRTGDGDVIEAGVVVIAADPRRAIVEWLTAAPAGFVAKWRKRPVAEGYESKIDAVITAPPAYRGLDAGLLDRLAVADPLVPTCIVSPPLAGIAAAHAAWQRGSVAARPLFFANVPSVLDPSMRAGDAHIFSLETLFTPFALDPAEPQRWLEVYGELVRPGFAESIARWRAMTPQTYEREFSMPRGYAPSYPASPLSTLMGRRDRELSRYETPVKGLYLSGAATFPGAGVWGAPGRNAALTILRRLT